MSPTERAIYERLKRRAATMQPDVARRYLTALNILRDNLTETELTRALREGSVERLLTELLDDQVQDDAFAPLRSLIDREAINAGERWARDVPSRVAPPVFDTLSPRIVEAVRELDTRVIVGMKDEVRETVRQAATAGLEAGQHPRTVARGIRESLGLAPNQEQAIRRFQEMLESGDGEALTRALRDRRFDGVLKRSLGRNGTGLGPDQIERMTSAYRRRMVAHNAEVHARTVALDTQRLAQNLSWQNAIEQGTVDRNRLRRKWITVGDDRVRPEHQAMNGEEIPFDGTYSNGETIPGQNSYNCRCIERVILVAADKLAA